MAAASVAGGAGAIAYLSSHSSSLEPHSDAKSGLSEFQRASPMRRGSIDVMQPVSQPGASEVSPVFVGICGGTGSGKTTVAESIARRLQGHGDRVTHISHDNYYKPLEHLSLKERTKQNFDHPDALDTALMVQHLAELKAGRRVNIPTCKQLGHRLRSRQLHHPAAPRPTAECFSLARARAHDRTVVRKNLREREERERGQCSESERHKSQGSKRQQPAHTPMTSTVVPRLRMPCNHATT